MNCKKCKKAGAYIRTRTNDVLCRQCGHVEKLETKTMQAIGFPDPYQYNESVKHHD